MPAARQEGRSPGLRCTRTSHRAPFKMHSCKPSTCKTPSGHQHRSQEPEPDVLLSHSSVGKKTRGAAQTNPAERTPTPPPSTRRWTVTARPGGALPFLPQRATVFLLLHPPPPRVRLVGLCSSHGSVRLCRFGFRINRRPRSLPRLPLPPVRKQQLHTFLPPVPRSQPFWRGREALGPSEYQRRLCPGNTWFQWLREGGPAWTDAGKSFQEAERGVHLARKQAAAAQRSGQSRSFYLLSTCCARHLTANFRTAPREGGGARRAQAPPPGTQPLPEARTPPSGP